MLGFVSSHSAFVIKHIYVRGCISTSAHNGQWACIQCTQNTHHLWLALTIYSLHLRALHTYVNTHTDFWSFHWKVLFGVRALVLILLRISFDHNTALNPDNALCFGFVLLCDVCKCVCASNDCSLAHLWWSASFISMSSSSSSSPVIALVFFYLFIPLLLYSSFVVSN